MKEEKRLRLYEGHGIEQDGSWGDLHGIENFFAKKALSAWMENIYIRVSPRHKHRNDKALGVSPHILRCTRYRGTLLQMGFVMCP